MPYNLVNNDFGRKFLAQLKEEEFRSLYFLRYLNQSKYSECKRLAFEVLTVYVIENPLFNELSLFNSKEAHQRFVNWTMLNQPQLFARKFPLFRRVHPGG